MRIAWHPLIMQPFQAWVEAFPALRDLRSRLGIWLAECGVPEPQRGDVLLATHEAVANALEHARSSDPTLVRASTGPREVVVEVLDHGRWRASVAPRTEERGRGLDLIHQLVTSLEIVSRAEGTTVRMRQAVPVSRPRRRRAEPTAA